MNLFKLAAKKSSHWHRAPLLAIVLLPALATYSQAQSSSEATVEQLGGHDNQAQIMQQNAANAHAFVSQSGQSNRAGLNQTGPANALMANTLQDGEDNHVFVYQQGGDSAMVVSQQIGANNLTEIQQNGAIGGSAQLSAEVSVEGGNNVVHVVQETESEGSLTLSINGDSNRLDLHQAGHSATAEINSWDAQNNVDTISQFSTAGRVVVNRYHTYDSTATLYDNGELNRIALSQWASGGNTVYVTLDDTWSVGALVEQEHAYGTTVTIEANGTSTGQAEVRQYAVYDADAIIRQGLGEAGGSNLSALITQEGGYMPRAEIVQTGDTNQARIRQVDSAYSEALIVQDGSSGHAVIEQTGWNSEYNTAVITQAGDYSAYILQEGAHNQAAISQY